MRVVKCMGEKSLKHVQHTTILFILFEVYSMYTVHSMQIFSMYEIPGLLHLVKSSVSPQCIQPDLAFPA